MAMSARPIIIDSDVGWDDWLALLFLMKRTDIRILGVTVTGAGLAHLSPGIKIMRGLLAFGGQTAQVHAGLIAPLSLSNMFPGSFRSKIDGMWGLTIPPSQTPVPPQSPVDAVTFLYQALLAAAKSGPPVDLLCIGGFTTLGALLAAHPLKEYRAGIGTIYAMAGAVAVPGNVTSTPPPADPTDPANDTWGYYIGNTTAEWNVFIDPLGADLVMKSGLPIVLVPLDATQDVPVTTEFVDDYATKVGQDVYAKFVLDVLRLQAGQTDFFDPLAAAVLVTPSAKGLVTTKSMRLAVNVTLNEEQNSVGTLSVTTDPTWSAITVATSADAALFKTIFEQATLPHA